MSVAYETQRFATPPERTARLVAVLRQYLTPGARILDVGCGTGDVIFELADHAPDARFVGVDISAPNMAEGERRRLASPHRDRIEFVAGDIMTFDAPPFDILLSWSTLHLIPGRTDILFAKLTSLVRPEGIVIYTMPFKCAYNTLLITLRRLFRLVRCRWTDQCIRWAGRRMHPELDGASLDDRVRYMYIVPDRLDSETVHRQLRDRYGLHRIHAAPEPHASWAQPRHRLVAFRKATIN